MAESPVPNKSADKLAARLLRFLGNCGCALTEDEGRAQLLRPDGSETVIPAAAIAACLARGLAVRRGAKLFATAEARAWLRRFVAARDEAFLDQHRTVETSDLHEAGSRHTVAVNITSSPLATLARLKDRTGAAWLAPNAVEAGERLARDFHHAALQPRITQSYEPRTGERPQPGSKAQADLADTVLAARHRVNAAIDAMGPDLSGVALDICCFEKGLETVERERQWPPRSAKLMLRTALECLHRHYNPPLPAVKRRRHMWGGEGYRPEVSGRNRLDAI